MDNVDSLTKEYIKLFTESILKESSSILHGGVVDYETLSNWGEEELIVYVNWGEEGKWLHYQRWRCYWLVD